MGTVKGSRPAPRLVTRLPSTATDFESWETSLVGDAHTDLDSSANPKLLTSSVSGGADGLHAWPLLQV